MERSEELRPISLLFLISPISAHQTDEVELAEKNWGFCRGSHFDINYKAGQ